MALPIWVMVDPVMDVSASALRKGTAVFLGWWFGELSAIVPRRLFLAVKPVNRTVAVTLDETYVTLAQIHGDARDIIGRFAARDTDDVAGSEDLKQIIASHPAPHWRWGLYLDDVIALRDILRLPAAAIENLYETVEFQIERQTPFRRSEVYFNCRPLDPAASTNLMAVELVLARRDSVEAALNYVTAMGIPIDFVSTSSEQAKGCASFNLLRSKSSPRRYGLTRLNVALACLSVLFAGLLIYLPIDRDHRTAAALAARLEALRAETHISARLRTQIETEQRYILSVIKRKQEVTSLTRILYNLTRLLPDEAWLSELVYKHGTLRIAVHAPESGSIVRLIEGSNRFSDVRMVSEVRQEANSGREWFMLSFSAADGTSR